MLRYSSHFISSEDQSCTDENFGLRKEWVYCVDRMHRDGLTKYRLEQETNSCYETWTNEARMGQQMTQLLDNLKMIVT